MENHLERVDTDTLALRFEETMTGSARPEMPNIAPTKIRREPGSPMPCAPMPVPSGASILQSGILHCPRAGDFKVCCLMNRSSVAG